mmetsp:Transcript_11294/g.33466  ORF Transcript_11294/g.33466 Transcript_11294/m.33466 type:complete len:348 (+) Transcript_11294:52-1095(+)
MPVVGAPSAFAGALQKVASGPEAVDVRPLLLRDGHVCPEGLHLRHVEVRVDDAGLLLAGHQHLAPGVDGSRVAVGLILEARQARRGAGDDEALVVDGAAAREQLVVLRTRRGVEGAREQDHLRPLRPHEHGELGEAHVVADGRPHLAPGGVEDGGPVARRERVGLLEGHLARDVDVEQMNLAVLRQDGALRVHRHAGVVDLVPLLLRHGAAADVDALGLCHFHEHRRGWAHRRLCRLPRTGHLLRVLGKVLVAVGAVPALREADQLSASIRSLLDGLPGPRDVGALVRPNLELAEGDLEDLRRRLVQRPLRSGGGHADAPVPHPEELRGDHPRAPRGAEVHTTGPTA